MRIDRSLFPIVAALSVAAGPASARAQMAVEQVCAFYAPAMDVQAAPVIATAPAYSQYAHTAYSGVAAYESAYGASTFTEVAYLPIAPPVCTLAAAPPAPACIPTCAAPATQSPQTNQKPPTEPAREPNLEPVFIDPDAKPTSPTNESSQRQNVARPGLEPVPPRPKSNAVRSQSTGWTRTTVRRELDSPEGWRPVRK